MNRFYWVRSWDPYNGWVDVYEGWDQALAENWRHLVNPGALVIADIFDVTVGARGEWLPRETWQSYGGGGGGAYRDPRQIDAPLPVLPPGLKWTSLAQGDVPIKKAYYYDATASVKISHDRASIENMLRAKGMKLIDYSEKPASGGYREVHLIALATIDAGTVPWKVPWFVPGDSSTLLTVKTAPASSGAPALTGAGGMSAGEIAALATLGVLGAGTGWALWRRHKGKPFLPRLRA